jgi:LDH2 family malate/lactate/ureidoglycolate dehydrogenase
VKLAAQRGEQMPEGWMIDAEGNPLTDPTKAAGGSLLPIGGPKGYGLALMVGLLAGTLNTAAMGKNVVDFTKDDASSTNTGQCICVVNLAAMGDPAQFKAEVDRVRAEMQGSRTRPGFDEIRIPGDRALATRETRLRDGVPISPPLLDSLRPAAEAAGVAPLEDRI